MKLRLRWILLIGLVAACLVHGSWQGLWINLAAHFDQTQNMESLRISHTYLLEQSRWLEFHLPPGSDRTWVLANANFDPQVPEPEPADPTRPGAVFAVEYQLLDSQNRLLDAGIYHFRAQHPLADVTSSSRRAFYADHQLLPAAGQSMRLPLSSYEDQVSCLRLRGANHDPAVQDVAVRVYYREEIADYKLNYAWRRTSQQKREHLCRASVYGPDLLTDYERRNLLKWSWRPLSSHGVEGRDYERRILYSSDDESTDQEERTLDRPAGLVVRPGARGVVPLPHGTGTVRLEMIRLNDDRPADMYISWHGSRSEKIQSRHTRFSATEHQMEFSASQGLLDISATEEIVIRAYWRPDDASAETDFIDVTPRPDSVCSYLINPRSPVEYRITHVDQQPTPFKLVFRALLPPEAGWPGTNSDRQAPRHVRWSFLNKEQRVVACGEVAISRGPSRYDRVAGVRNRMQVTDSEVCFFSVPDGVQAVRLESPQEDLIVYGYSRPPDIPNVTVVPDDYLVFERQESERRRWFVVRPKQHVMRVNEFRTATVLVQPRPTVVDPQLVAGNYDWHCFRPTGISNARFLLVARDTRSPLRWESLGGAYYPVESGVEHHLQLRHAPGHRWVVPRLICHNPSDQSVPVSIFINDRLHQRLQVHPGLVDIELDALPVQVGNRPRIRIESVGQVCLLINHVASESETVFFKRTVTRIEGKSLQFEYEKQEPEEQLALSLFCAMREERARLRVRILGQLIRGVGPHRDWTVRDRIYELEPSRAAPAPLLSAGRQRVFEQEPCFFQLGTDLPLGRYTIQVTREDDTAGYLLLSKTTPGLSERRSLTTEPRP
jgi:hypothetical protein